MRGRVLAERRVGIGHLLVADPPMTIAGKKGGQAGAPADEPDDSRDQDDQREGSVEKEDRDEGRRCDSKQDVVVERALADPNDRLQHDRQYGRLQAEEHGLHRADIAKGGIDPTQSHEGDEAGENEECPGDESAPGLVQQPPDVDCELLRLRSRQQHAVVQGVKKPGVSDPAYLLDQDSVHHRDLPRRAAEAQRRDLDPHPEGLAEGNAMSGYSPTGFGGLDPSSVHRLYVSDQEMKATLVSNRREAYSAQPQWDEVARSLPCSGLEGVAE